MLNLLVIAIFGLVFALLATQNTQGVDLRLGSYVFNSIPLYLVALSSFILGLLVSTIVSIIDSLFNFFKFQSKDYKIKASTNTIEDLEHKVNNLEAEIARLRGIRNLSPEPTEPRPSLFHRLRHRLSI